MTNWTDLIRTMVEIHAVAAEADEEGLIQAVPPPPGAAEEELVAAEEALGFPLDANFRGFLEAADGWERFFYGYRVFGTQDFVSGGSIQAVRDLLAVASDVVEPAVGSKLTDLLPIGAHEYSTGTFLLMLEASGRAGEVVWEESGEIHVRCRNFEEFFRWMMEYQTD
jgi:hypothetical protein